MTHPDAIVAYARGWLGTPYHHQGSVRGAGCDCLGLIRGVWRTLYGPEPEAMPAYARDWGDATGSETLIAAACRHLVPLGCVSDARAGDVLVFRMRDKGVAKHAGILSALPEPDVPYRPPAYLRARLLERDGSARLGSGGSANAETATMIHAQEGLGVVEVPLGAWWRRRAVAAFRFPS